MKHGILYYMSKKDIVISFSDDVNIQVLASAKLCNSLQTLAKSHMKI